VGKLERGKHRWPSPGGSSEALTRSRGCCGSGWLRRR
jgi:hypothetical protein